jgi:hypothetical protein
LPTHTALGLAEGALLVVDRAKNPAPNDLVLLAHMERFLCRLLEKFFFVAEKHPH